MGGRLWTDALRAALEGIPLWILIAVAFLAGAIEAMPVIGMIIPANSVVFLLALHWATLDRKPVGLVLGYAAGSFLGDIVVYLAGRRYGLQFMERWPGLLRLSPERRVALEGLFDAHGVKTVLIARLQPVTRSFAPYVAGASRLSPVRFLAAAAAASFAMALVVVLGGYLTGIGLEAVGKALGWVMGVTVAAVLALALLYFWLSHKLRLVTHTTLSLALAAGMVGGAFLGLAVDAGFRRAWTQFEEAHWVHGLENVAALELPAYVVAVLTHAWALALVAAAAAGWCAWKGLRREMGLLIAAGPGLLAAVALLQFALPRDPPLASPSLLLVHAGFPAASAALAASLAMLALWLWRRPGRNPWQRRLVTSAAVAAVALVAGAPLALGTVWPTQTAGGLSFGIFWGSIVLLLDVANQRRKAAWAALATK